MFFKPDTNALIAEDTDKFEIIFRLISLKNVESKSHTRIILTTKIGIKGFSKIFEADQIKNINNLLFLLD